MLKSLSALELKLIPQFRERVADIEVPDWKNNDAFFVTWLRARDHNLKKAEEMFRKSAAWWKAKDINNLVQYWKPEEHYRKNFEFKFVGYDQDNLPIMFANPGKWDVRSIIETDGKDSYLKYLQWVTASMLGQLKELGSERGMFVYQFVVILDVGGYSLRQLTSYATVQAHLETVRDFEANFPETLKIAYVINMNKWVGAILSLMKPLLSGKTLSKLIFLDTSSEEWKSVLKNNSLSLDIQNCGVESKDLDHSEFETATVLPGKQFKLSYQVEDPVKLSWKFKTDVHDIAFGLNFSDANVNCKELIDIQRQPAGSTVQQNSIWCSEPGNYTLTFDNSYSRFRSKILYYSVHLDCESES